MKTATKKKTKPAPFPTEDFRVLTWEFNDHESQFETMQACARLGAEGYGFAEYADTGGDQGALVLTREKIDETEAQILLDQYVNDYGVDDSDEAYAEWKKKPCPVPCGCCFCRRFLKESGEAE